MVTSREPPATSGDVRQRSSISGALWRVNVGCGERMRRSRRIKLSGNNSAVPVEVAKIGYKA
jgi:hypothetical protein